MIFYRNYYKLGNVVAHSRDEVPHWFRKCGGLSHWSDMWWLIGLGDVVAHWFRRCGASLVVLQTTETVVTGSNMANLTVKNSEKGQSSR